MVFTYLKSHLKGRALSLIENLPINNNSLQEAWTILERVFLDRGDLIEKTLESIRNHKDCRSNLESRTFLEFVSAKLLELEWFDLDYTHEPSAQILMSLIIKTKLHAPFLMELSRKVGSTHVTVEQMLDNSTAVYNLLKGEEPKPKDSPHSNYSKDYYNKNSTSYSKTYPKKVTQTNE